MNSKEFSFDKVWLVLRRWHVYFIIPFFVVLLTMIAYVGNLKVYRSEAIVLFESNYIPLEEYFTLLDKLEDQPVNIIRSLLYGSSAEKIVESTWPEVKGNQRAINGKIAHLRSSSGIELRFQRDNPQALSLSYQNTSPGMAYKVVKNTIDQLIEYNQEVTKNRLETGMQFFQQELDKARDDLGEIEQQIVRVRSGLPLEVLEAHDKHFESIEEILDLAPLNYDIEKNLAKALNFNESVSEIEFQLKIAKEEMKQLKLDLESKAYLGNSEDLEIVLNASKDPEINSINQKIVSKKQELSSLESKGFKAAHPEVLAASKEIKILNQLKQKKLLDIQASLNQENAELTNLRLEKRQSKKIEDKTREIQLLGDRLTATIAYQDKFKDRNVSLDDKLKELSERKTKLVELESKKIVTSHSYAQMAKRLSVLKREIGIDQDKFGLSVKVVEPPQIPTIPLVLAGLPLIAIALVVSSGILLMLAALIALFDTKIYSNKELFAVTTKPILGSVDSFKIKSEQLAVGRKYRYLLLLMMIYAIIIWLYFASK